MSWVTDDMRATVAQVMVDTAEIFREQRVPDTSGGFSVSWISQGAVACQFRRASLRDLERLRHTQVQGTVRQVWLDVNADVRVGDRLVWDGTMWEVVDVETKTQALKKVALVVEVP